MLIYVIVTGHNVQLTGKPRASVAMVIVSLGDGGAARVAISTAAGLDPAEFDVHLICMFRVEPTDYVRDLLDGSTVTVHTLDKKLGPDLAAFLRLRRLLRALKPDIVHSHGRLLHYVVPLTARKAAHHHLHTVHSTAAGETNPLMRRFYGVAFRRWVTPVGIANVVSQSLEETYGLVDFPMVYNGIDVTRFCNPRITRHTWREKHRFDPDDTLVTCVAMLRPVKNHDVLIEAAGRLMADRPKLHLLLVGTGPLLAQLDAHARSNGIRRCVHILGERGDIPEILAASDVFAMASSREGHPLAIMEAMAAGCAVVATRVGGTPEVIDDEVDGVLVPAGDAGALAGALARVVDDVELRQRLGSRAAARAREHFDVGVMTERYADLYRALAP